MKQKTNGEAAALQSSWRCHPPTWF